LTSLIRIISLILSYSSVQHCLESPTGRCFAQFSHQLLRTQALTSLYRHIVYTFRLGGLDQHRSIVSGPALIHLSSSAAAVSTSSADQKGRRGGEGTEHAFGLTTSTEETFALLAANAVWLDEKQTSAFDLWAGQSVPPSPSLECGAHFTGDSSPAAHETRTPGGTSGCSLFPTRGHPDARPPARGRAQKRKA
jgi:hypothetical protein